MTQYIAEIQRQLVSKYRFAPREDYPDIPKDKVPDGVYPMTIDGSVDNVKITNGKISCCNFEPEPFEPDEK